MRSGAQEVEETFLGTKYSLMARRGLHLTVSQFSIQGVKLFFFFTYYFKVSNHSVIVGISFVDFLSTDFTCPSISYVAQEAKALRERPWCPGPSVSLAPRAVALPFLLHAECLPSFSMDQKQTKQLGIGQIHPGQPPWSWAALSSTSSLHPLPHNCSQNWLPSACSGMVGVVMGNLPSLCFSTTGSPNLMRGVHCPPVCPSCGPQGDFPHCVLDQCLLLL